MYKIYYDREFYLKMSNFSNYLKNYFYKLYTDTWIIDEEIIMESYEKSIDLLQKQIIDKIENFCKDWILWRKVLSESKIIEKWYFFITINSYKIKITFLKDKKLNKIIITSVKINT